MFRTWKRRRLAIGIVPALLLLLAGGCGSRGSGEGLPPEDVGRKSLEAALTAWREGGKPGTVEGMDPRVEVHDTPWSRGDRLSSYEIVGENKTGAEMKFSVRLSLAKPDRVQEAEYYVLGRDPVMVFRDEDYERNINMVNGPSTEKAANRRRRQR